MTLSFSASGLASCELEPGRDVQDPHHICLASTNMANTKARKAGESWQSNDLFLPPLCITGGKVMLCHASDVVGDTDRAEDVGRAVERGRR